MLPVSLFVGLMIASAGVAVYPPLAFIATPLVCSGEVDVESQSYSYRPGQRGVTRTIWCQTGGGEGAKPAREDITFKAIGASFVVYSAIAFVVLQLLWWLLRRRFTESLRARLRPGAGVAGGSVDLSGILAQVRDAVDRGEARVTVRNMTMDMREEDGRGGDDDPAERLAQLKRLHDQGLISAAEYQAKRAEILSGL